MDLNRHTDNDESAIRNPQSAIKESAIKYSATLNRGIGRWDLVAVAINGIIGAGIFGLPSKVFALIGPYSLTAFFACALVVMLIVLCFAEVSSRFSETGGPYLYAREAFGPAVGFEVGWLMWLARLTAFAANLNLLVEYLNFFWPAATSFWPRLVTIMVIVFSLTTINVIGVRDAAMVSDLFTIGKLIPIAFFIVVGLFFIDPQNFSPAAAPGVLSFSQSVMLLVYAFTGFEMALIPAGEVRDPQRNIPFAILAAVAATAFIYILIQVICIGTLPELAGSGRPIADAAGKFMGTAGAGVITAGVIVSIIGNLIVLILAAARLPFAMAERRELPGIFAGVHRRFRTPHVAIWVTGAVMLAITLSGTFIYAATISVIARLLAYAVTCLALLALRRKNEKPAVFVAPGGFFVSIAALALILWLLSNSTLSEARDAGIAAAVGLLVYAMKR